RSRTARASRSTRAWRRSCSPAGRGATTTSSTRCGRPARRWCSRVAATSATEVAEHFRLLARSEQAALLALPWTVPLEEWPPALFVEVERGSGLYALKEVPPRIAQREYRLLLELEEDNVPAVEAEGIVSERQSVAGE